MTLATHLQCKECKTQYPLELRHVCDECFGSLDVKYDYDKIGDQFKQNVLGRPSNLWKYKELLPINQKNRYVNIHAGYTPLKKAETLGKLLGLKNLYLKDDTTNPSGSFKDRPTTIAVSKALEFKLKAVGCASTGNLASATAAAAAHANLPCHVFVPRDLDQEKLVTPIFYGAMCLQLMVTMIRLID